MPITKQAKQDLVASLTTEVSAAKEQVLVGYKGLTVADMQELRKKLREEGMSLRVVKTTLLNRVFADAKIDGLDAKAIKKPVALVIGNDEVMPAKILVEFGRTHKQLEILSGALDKKAISKDMINSLASLPGRQDMLGILVGTFAAPMSSFVRVLSGVPRSLVQVLSQISKSKA